MTSKRSARDFAISGGARTFDGPLPAGQFYFPTWDRYEAAMRDIFERQYYTNHGPLAQQLERRLADRFEMEHVICVTNATLGLIMAVKALGLRGRVILPAFGFIGSAQSLTWAGVEPVFCEVDAGTHQLSIEHVAELLRTEADIGAILGVNLWGGCCGPKTLAALAERHGVDLYFDSAHGFGCAVDDAPIGRFGRLEVFSFHSTEIFSTGEGGCITTNDGALAARLRNIRSSYGAGSAVEVPLTSNGRFSEAQAAVGLLNLDTVDDALANNRASFDEYRSLLAPITGISVVEPRGVTASNYQWLVCEIEENEFGLSRDALRAVLNAENIGARRLFFPGIHRSLPYIESHPRYVDALPVTDRLCSRLIQLPIGALATLDRIRTVCEVIDAAHRHAAGLSQLKEVA